MLRGASEQRVVGDPAQELRVVVVEREHPAELLRRLLGFRADPHRPVRRLPGPRDAAAAAGHDHTLAHPSRRVSGEPAGERERVRTARTDVQFDHVPSLLARVDTPERASCGRVGPGLPSPDVSRSLTQRDLLLAAALVVVAVVAFSSLRSHHATSSILADPARTPGVLNPDVTQANIRSTICRHGWTATIRPPVEYTNDLKRKQMRLYGETGSLSDYQEDHLISLELGGNPTDPRNLWPEPYPRAADVDKIENELNAEVCSGQLTLAEAQQKEDDLKHSQG